LSFAKASNIHTPQLLPSRERVHPPAPLSRGDSPSTLAGEGKSKE